jgi:hypothetical protein
MPKFTTFVIGCAFASALIGTNASASIISLGVKNDPYYVGVITPDGGSIATEMNEIKTLVNCNAMTTCTSGGETYTRSNKSTIGLPDPTKLTFTKSDSSSIGAFLVSGYILAKYDNNRAGAYVWYIDKPTQVLVPAALGNCGKPSAPSGCGLSHVIYNAAPVTDSGGALVLLSSALMAIASIRRKFHP